MLWNNKMKDKKNKIVIEKNSDFVERVLLLSLPPAFVFIMLVFLHIISAPMAIMSYASIILFDVIMLLPISFEMQRIRNYISSLSTGNEIDVKDMMLNEQDSKQIATAINQLHRFWSEKNDMLTAQTMSDAAVLDTLPDPIIIIDKKQNIVGANLQARNIFGDDMAGKNVKELLDSEALLKGISAVIDKETDSENLVFYLDDENKRKMYAHIKQLPWFSNGQSEVVISIYDLSKVVKLEKAQSDFVANASHELRTPLSVISGFIETLQTSAKDDAKARDMFLKIMKEQSDYMAQLIENLLSLSRIEMSDAPKPTDTINVEDLIPDVKNALLQKLKQKNMQLNVIKEVEKATAVADNAQIKQVLQNLIDNAIKYGDENSVITLKFSAEDKIPAARDFEIEEGPALVISVNSRGEPIKKEQIERLTERFYRLQTHRDKNIKGTGLGLSIVKHIIMRHKGNLIIRSDKRHGTTFSVYLPKE